MAGLAASCRPIAMGQLGLACKDRLAQTLFVQLQNNPALTALCHSLGNGISQSPAYQLVPHLSLLYQKLPAPVREALMREILVPMRQISFDELWAMAIPGQLKSLHDFSAGNLF